MGSTFSPLETVQDFVTNLNTCSRSDTVTSKANYKRLSLSRFLCGEPRHHHAVRKSNQAHAEKPFDEAHVKRNRGCKPPTSINHWTCEWVNIQMIIASPLCTSQLRPQASWSRANCPFHALSKFPTCWIYKKQNQYRNSASESLEPRAPVLYYPSVSFCHSHNIGISNVWIKWPEESVMVDFFQNSEAMLCLVRSCLFRRKN